VNARKARPGAGASAHDMAQSIAAEGRQLRLALLAGLLVLVAAFAWWLLGSLQAALGIAVMVGAGVVIFRATRRDDASKWRKGAAGERSTARILRRLERRGYVILHDRALDRETDVANIDHLVIGPCGPVVVDSKNWHKNTMIKYRRGEVWVGRARGAKVVAGTAVERRRVSTVLTAALGERVEAYGVLAVHGAKLPYWRRPAIEAMPLLRARAVRRWITSLPARYDAATVAQMAEIAEASFPPYQRPEVL
jgi:hypothetical protein